MIGLESRAGTTSDRDYHSIITSLFVAHLIRTSWKSFLEKNTTLSSPKLENMLQIKTVILSATKYFLLVFSAGFICGSVRVPLLQPRIGDRHAQLLEMPIMLLAIWKSSHFIVRGLSTPRCDNKERPHAPPVSTRFAIGITALILTLGAEMMGQTCMAGWTGTRAFVFDRDPVAGTVYFMSLGFLAVLPACIS